MKDKTGYSQAISEIESIVEEIETETVDVDVLAEKVKRATYLIKLCKEKLRETDKEVKNILKEFDRAEDRTALD